MSQSATIFEPDDLQYDDLLIYPLEYAKAHDVTGERRHSHGASEESFLSCSSTSSDSKRRGEEESSSDDTPHQKRVKRHSDLSENSSDCLRVPGPYDKFRDFRDRPRTAYVDKTSLLFQLPDRFKYLLLRPPKFGKTAFLSTMNQFYDIHCGKTFMDYFEIPEGAGPCAEPCHSQDLCLVISLSNLHPYIDAAEFREELAYEVFFEVESFLEKYATELGVGELQTYLVDREDALAKVLALVKSRGKTLFVGVDSYDVPVFESVFPRLICPTLHPALVTPNEIAQLLDSYLWRPLEAAGDAVTKLFVTGTFSVQTRVLRSLVVPAPDVLQPCCGFTEEEVLKFVQSIPHEPTPEVPELRIRCGTYAFSSDKSIHPVLHPEILIGPISKLSSQQPRESPFQLLSSLFDRLPLESELTVPTLDGLVELIASGVVEIDPFEFGTRNDFDETSGSVSWSALYHAGALTRVSGSKSAFRVANSEVLSQIHSRIDTLVRRRVSVLEAGGQRFADALTEYQLEHPQPLLDLLGKVLCDQTRRSFGKVREPTLRGLLELIMRNADLVSCVPSKLPESTILPPDDTSCVRVLGVHTDHIYQWEVTTLTLRGIWQAANPNDTDTEPSAEALRQLHEELCQEEEERLLERDYSVWSTHLQAMETRPIGGFFKPEGLYAQVIAVGGARVLRKAGSAELIIVP
ncbi:hypothetical protein FB45DRAFT_891593 [Roridomyces roridus]|uniref:AAA-ATPase-like domain-containing protein n=1 Tax=Roridomyces roridus TaxID=1738132 RepID=A0AAD7CE74_9AGAR|nr:hypothetical protein FB45DRAFT_891593 [Roridomyces roridus]